MAVRFSLKLLLIFIGCILPMILVIITQHQYQLTRCRENFRRLNQALSVYHDEFGKSVFYPDANGSLFFYKLYTSGLLSEPRNFLCPATNDSNDNGNLLTNLTVGDTQNLVSYAGRKNAKQNAYPGLYLTKNDSFTPLGSDDINQPAGENHSSDVIFLFKDGHSESFSKKNSEDDINYINYWRDPLTN